MIFFKNTHFIFIVSTLFWFSCGSKNDTAIKYHPEFPEVSIDTTPLIPLPSSWKIQKELMSGFPTGIQAYRNTSVYKNKTINVYCVVFDPLKIELKPVLAQKNQSVSDFYKGEAGVLACINAGFFGTNTSYSLIKYNDVVAAVNIKSLSRQYNNTTTIYYPTRGAFGINANGVPEVTWIYHTSGNSTIYAYPAPSPNDVNQAPQPVPGPAFPAGGAIWNVKNAVGGSPVLLKDNTEVNSADAELIVIDNTISRARSAIGCTSSGKVVLLAAEGNNPSGAPGLNLSELSGLMKEMGCTAALNLDGGGSTAMVINGKTTVRPSDNGVERAVMSAVLLKKL